MRQRKEFQRRRAERQKKEDQKNALVGFGRTWFRHPDPMIRFTFWVAAFTLVLGLVGTFQLYAFIRSEQSFVSISFDPLELTPDKPVVIRFTLHNSGKETVQIDHFSMGTMAEDSLPNKPDYSKLVAPVIFPPLEGLGTAHLSFGLRFPDGVKPLTLTADQIKVVNSGGPKMAVFGVIEYSDDLSFFGSRQNRFCAIYNPASDGGTAEWNTCENPEFTGQ